MEEDTNVEHGSADSSMGVRGVTGQSSSVLGALIAQFSFAGGAPRQVRAVMRRGLELAVVPEHARDSADPRKQRSRCRSGAVAQMAKRLDGSHYLSSKLESVLLALS